jgi:hypothetical protein
MHCKLNRCAPCNIDSHLLRANGCTSSSFSILSYIVGGGRDNDIVSGRNISRSLDGGALCLHLASAAQRVDGTAAMVVNEIIYRSSRWY